MREVEGTSIEGWYHGLTVSKGHSQGTAVRHFNVMHHMMKKAATIWSRETGIERNPADAVEVKRPDDQRNRYLDAGEIARLKATLDDKMSRKAGKGINQTFYRLRLIVLVALTTGMRIAEIFGLKWGDLLYREDLIAVQAKLKGGKMRYVPMAPELAAEFRSYPAVLGEEQIFPPEPRTNTDRQELTKASRPFSIWPALKISGFTTSGTHSPVGT